MSLVYLITIHLVGLGGGLLLRRTRVPAGALIGALLSVMIYNSFFEPSTPYPGSLRIFIQILSGLVIGTRFTREDIKTLRSMILPVIILVVTLLATNVIFAYLMERTTSLSFMTSFFACAPGGVSDLALVATDFGAVMEHVALLQLFRLISVIIIFPPMIRWMLRIDSVPAEASSCAIPKPEIRVSKRFYLPTLLAALLGGITFYLMNIPAGPILGAIIAVAVLNLATDSASYPKLLKVLVQVFAGSYIGSRITIQTLTEIQLLLLPALILMVELFFMAFVTAYILHKICRLDWATALFSSTPGGIQEMGLISDELGLETPKIVLMHTFRILAVLGVLPLIAGIIG